MNKTQKLGLQVSAVGLWIIFIWIGVYKFTPTEAQAILPLIENSPFFSWQLAFWDIQTISNIIGTTEIITALLMIAGLKNNLLGQLGYGIGVLTFLVTITFLFTTPGMFKHVDGLIIANGFLLKDIILLGVCLAHIDLSQKPWTLLKK